jgi:hypothetical protein
VVVKTSTVSHEYGDKKWVGFPKFCEALKDDPALAAELTVKIGEARDAKRDSARREQEAKKAAVLAPIVDDAGDDTTEVKKRKKGK